jgi:hypothetical protein
MGTAAVYVHVKPWGWGISLEQDPEKPISDRSRTMRKYVLFFPFFLFIDCNVQTEV